VNARGPVWPLGTYELASFNGQDFPAELPDGRTLLGGSCTLSKRTVVGTHSPIRDPSVRFRMGFRFPEARRRYSRQGSVWIGEGPVEGARIPLQFVASVGMDWGSGFDEFPLEWAHREEATGTLFGNELRVGDGDKFIVFMRR